MLIVDILDCFRFSNKVFLVFNLSMLRCTIYVRLKGGGGGGEDVIYMYMYEL